MSDTKEGTIKLIDDGSTRTLMVKDTPDKAFQLSDRFWDLVKGNAGQPIKVTYTPGAPDVVTAVEVG